MAPLIHNLGLTQTEPPIPIGQEAGFTLESVQTQWREVGIPAHAGNRTPVVQPIAYFLY